jgi:hypothetical protein
LRRKSARPKPRRLVTSCFLSGQPGAKVPMLVSFVQQPSRN